MEAAALQIEEGGFLWHELTTTDRDAAVEFYGEVLGWEWGEYVDEAGDYYYEMWHAGGVPVAGMVEEAADEAENPDNQDDAENPGSPIGSDDPDERDEAATLDDYFDSRWIPYVHTQDLEKTAWIAEDMSDIPAGDFFEAPIGGRAAGIMDMLGTFMWAVQTDGTGPTPKRPVVGSFTWNVLSVDRPVYGLYFYGRLLDWELMDLIKGARGRQYFIYGKGGKPYGLMHNEQLEPEITPFTIDEVGTWMHYVSVGDVVETLAKVQLNGGRIVSGPKKDPLGVRIAHCLDPQGAAFGLREERG